MSETKRIRWTEQSDGGWLGHAGAIERSLFMIIPPFLGRWELHSTLPGWDRALLRAELDELKDHAERWLEEFVSSLGAIFPEPGFEFPGDDGEPLEVKYAPGRRVRYAHPDYGYPGEQEPAASILVLGAAYTIARHSIGQSRTDLMLEGIPGEWFNSVLFEPADDEPAKEAGQ